jgi:iron(III) transport system permease protein
MTTSTGGSPAVSGNTSPERAQSSPQPKSRLPWPSSRVLIGVIITMVVLYLVITPIVFVLGSAFQTSETGLPLTSEATWTFENLKAVFSSAKTYELLGTTIGFATGSITLGGTFAVTLAWLTERTDLPLSRTIFVLVVATAGLPGLVFALAWASILNPAAGPVNDFLRLFGLHFNPYSMAGMILVEGLQIVPVLFLLISASLRRMNPALEAAAAASGASAAATFFRVSVPLFAPAAIAALIYSFVLSVDAVAVPLVFGLPGNIQVLSVHVWLTAQPSRGLPDYGIASTHALLLMALALLPLLFYSRVMQRANRYATVTGKGYRLRKFKLGKRRWPIFGVVFAFVLIQAVMPIMMLFWSSIQPYYAGFGPEALKRISWAAWGDLGSRSVQTSILTTIKVGFAAALITVAVAVVGSWVSVRGRSRGSKWLDMLMFAPQLLPGVVIALAILLMYLILPVGIYGTMWLLVAAFVVSSLPLTSRVTGPGVAQLGVSLEEAAFVSGARLRHLWFYILIPLLKGVIAIGVLLSFQSAIQNLTIPLMLGTSAGNSRMLAGDIYDVYQNIGSTTRASVLCIVLVGITFTCAIVIRWTDKSRVT